MLFRSVFLKLDFAKAFDTIEWDFLLRVFEARGFPQKWNQWILMLLTTASSRVLINGDASSFFLHKRGLRQGDPLSPMLFNIATDVFQRMLIETGKTLQGGITQKIREPFMAFQYADDTAIVASANITVLSSLKLLIRLYARISGLCVNYDKSKFIPINVSTQDLVWVKAVLGCQKTKFPVQYLGMPLSIVMPRKKHFQPLLERVERKLGGWKSRMISRGGRLQLVQSDRKSVV